MLKRLFRRGKQSDKSVISPKPNHVAVIMDGNGRWANSRGLSRVAGHKQGADAVKALLRGCIEHEISYLSIFAFSSENWNRPAKEVAALMELFSSALDTQAQKFNEHGIRLNLIGDLSKFSDSIQLRAAQIQAETAHNDKLIFNVAVNYGGRWDIVQACQRLAQQVEIGSLKASEVTEQLLAEHLVTKDTPDPDLFIRTSGEYRISNFMLWQSAYAEFYFTNVLWPDFDESEFTKALIQFSERDRRFGNAKDSAPEGAKTWAVKGQSMHARKSLAADTVELGKRA